MTAKDVVDPAAIEFDDEFGPYLEQSKQDPAFRAAYEDAEQVHKILDSLVSLRKALRLSQTEVAKRMNVRQPTVSGFENEGSDPRLSTLQRYARAVQARLRVKIEMPAECDWVSTSTAVYARTEPKASEIVAVHKGGELAKAWRSESKSDDWVLVA